MGEDRISENFRFSEFTKSDVAERNHITNAITSWLVRDNIIALVENILQPLRDAWEEPLVINSGYRCLELNKKIGGVSTSQHVLGQAADVECSDPLALARLVKKLELPFDQMGLYPTFVHLSHSEDRNRGQIFYSKEYKGEKICDGSYK